MRVPRPAALILFALLLDPTLGGEAPLDEKTPATTAERSGFRETTRHDEVLALIGHCAKQAPHVRQVEFGRTVEGRPLLAAVIARPPFPNGPHNASPDAGQLANDPRLVVLLLGNIHAGECDGKEALLMLTRELAANPDHPLLRDLILLVVPNFNADGNERLGRKHRPGQDGPELAGRRENAQWLDLNRDFVKLECPETRALVGLMNHWNPHLTIDAHTTNGSRHRYDLTYASAHHPATPVGIREFLNDRLLPAVTAGLAERGGFDTFFYGNFNDDRTRWSSYGHQPRYGIEYLGVRGRMAILAESYVYLPFERRVRATQAFILRCLVELAARRAEARTLLDDAQRRTIEAGQHPAVGDELPLRSRQVARDRKATVRGYEDAGATADGTPRPLAANDRPRDYEVELHDRYEPTHSVQRPFAYLLPRGSSRLADRLRMHGLPLEQLADETMIEVEVQRVTNVERAAEPFQGHRQLTLETETRRETRSFAPGTYVIRTAHPLGNLAVELLEPMAEDGLATWNFLDTSIEKGRDVPVLRVAAPVAMPTRLVAEVRPDAELDLEQIYGPDRSIPLDGAPALGVQWLPSRRAAAVAWDSRPEHGPRQESVDAAGSGRESQATMGGSSYLRTVDGTHWRVDAATGAIEPLYDPREMERALKKLPGISDQDARGLARSLHRLDPHATATLFSFANDLFLYRFGDGDAKRLTNTPQVEQLATFSPDGRMVAFVRDHNLWVVECDSGQERALTTEGSALLLCGELDWVYQEEVYGRGNFQGFWWSPDSTHLALLRLDQSPVHEYTVADHIPYRQELEVTRYPKAGDPLPRASLGVVRAAGGAVRWISDQTLGPESIVARVGWTPDSRRVVFQVQNRPQTWLELRAVAISGGEGRRLVREESAAWVNVLGEPQWRKDGSFLWLSERSGQQHIHVISADGQLEKTLTSGDWEVQELFGIDPAEQWAYFLAARESAASADAYRVRLEDGVTERLTRSSGTHVVRFNDRFTHFIDAGSTAGSPARVDLRSADGEFIHTIDPNLVDHLAYYRIRPPEFLRVPARDGTTLEAMMITPPDFDPGGGRKYPVLCYVYSGPQNAVVRDRWGGPNYLWHQMLAQRGYVIWLCDNRSASARGVRHAWPIHRRLGELELADIEDGVTWVKKQAWADSERIGIWGWSYGGYMTAYALTHSTSFKVGISGAPVTDWRNYDAIYTERYMGLPQDNPEGYKASSVIEAASRLHGKLLLVHGTTDDNVHVSNSLQLAYELQKAGKPFQMMVYPRNRHAITQPQQARHLRELMTRFVLENL